MTAADLAVVLGGVALMGALAWYFFAPRQATQARVEGDRQVADIVVRGGYSPSVVRVRAGQPVRLRFDRQDNSGCTARVVFPDLRQSASLEAFGTTSMDLEITEPGEYDWACGMNMLHGTLIVEPAGEGDDDVGLTAGGDTRESARAVGVGPTLESGPRSARAAFTLPGALRSLPIDVVRAETALRTMEGVDSAQVNFGAERAVLTYDPTQVDLPTLRDAVEKATGFEARVRTHPGSARTEDAEDETRRAEVRDLKVRVAVGALLTLPVLYAAMVRQLFGEQYVPDLLENPYTQLAITLPVFLWVGWPIHSIGWRALLNRSAAAGFPGLIVGLTGFEPATP